MCQEPLMRMCVARIRSPEKNMRHHLPRDSTRSTVRPTIGVSSLTRASGASAVSKPVTIFPPNAFCSVRAARKMLSPSGITAGILSFRAVARQSRQTATHSETERRGMESRIQEKACQRVLRDGDAVDGRDEQTAPLVSGFAALALHVGDEELR